MTGDLVSELEALKDQGLYKAERQIVSMQSSLISVQTEDQSEDQGVGTTREFINFCANNYLGLADSEALISAATEGLEKHGYGMASVRFICGTQDIHKQLEARLSDFLDMDDAILFSSCFDANTGIFEVLLDDRDAIISDSLNHASIIDGVRLCKARRFRYSNNSMDELEQNLRESADARYRMIVTDGVFSMDGVIARLEDICDLAEEYDAMVMVDDSHAVGFMGDNGSGTPEFCGVKDRVHIVSGTFGKALGGASGGYIAGPGPIVEMLRQRARPYLFSNSVTPAIVNATLKALELVSQGREMRKKLVENAVYFRAGLESLGFTLAGAQHPIIPVMIGDAVKAQKFAGLLGQLGIYVTAFSFPVVPKEQARIRTQMSAVHTKAQLDTAIEMFEQAGKQLQII
jgi:glycine C-acetyltransferase